MLLLMTVMFPATAHTHSHYIIRDTAGQERYETLTAQYYRKAQVKMKLDTVPVVSISTHTTLLAMTVYSTTISIIISITISILLLVLLLVYY